MTFISTPGWGLVTPSYTWAFEGLSTGLAGFDTITDKGSIVWDAGGFARVTSNVAGVTALRYVVPAGNPSILVEYEIRRQMSACSKQLKALSQGVFVSPYTKYSNFTFGTAIGGYNNINVGIIYSDDSNGGDNDVGYYCNAVLSGGSVPNRSAPTFLVYQASQVTNNISGTVWEKYKVWWKPNSDNTADGEFAVWKDDVLVLHAINVWNCATTNSDGTNPGVSSADLYLYQDRGQVGLFEYANAAGVIEDYRNFKIGYTRPAGI